MNGIGAYRSIDQALASIHGVSIKAASSLEAQDQKDFGKTCISSDEKGVRTAEVYLYDPNGSCKESKCTEKSFQVGVTAEKIKELQKKELTNLIVKAKENTPEPNHNPLYALGRLVTSILDTCSDEIERSIPKRSESIPDSEKCDGSWESLALKSYCEGIDSEYLKNESVVEEEWTRLCHRGQEISNPEGMSFEYSEKSALINASVDKAAKELVESEFSRAKNNGRGLVGIVALTCVIAINCLSR